MSVADLCDDLSPDLLRLIIPKLALWDARSMQLSHPVFVRAVSDVVAAAVDGALVSPRPPVVDAFLKSRPGFQERTNGGFVMLRTPRDLTIQHVHDRVAVVLNIVDHRAKLCVRVLDPSARPTFDTLVHTLRALWWFATAVAALPGVTQVRTRTHASVHHPTSEVLNTLATAFVERHVHPLFMHAHRTPAPAAQAAQVMSTSRPQYPE